MTSNRARMMNLLSALVLVWCFTLSFNSTEAVAAPCEEKDEIVGDQNPDRQRTGVIALYTRWRGFEDIKARNHEERILQELSDSFDTKPCTITKETFPSLAATNLFNISSVRRMLQHQGVLANDETFMKKLEKRRIKLLVFLDFYSNGTSVQMKLMSVRIDDPSGAFADGWFTPLPEPIRGDRLDDLIVDLTKEVGDRHPDNASPFPVMITCFANSTPGAPPPRLGWDKDNMASFKHSIPKELATKLMAQFQDKFPIEFEGAGCEQKIDNESALAKEMNDKFAKKYGRDRWFVWRGWTYLEGNNHFGVKIEFLHFINQKKEVRLAHWHAHPDNIIINQIADHVATTVLKDWGPYLADISRKRPDLPKQ